MKSIENLRQSRKCQLAVLVFISLLPRLIYFFVLWFSPKGLPRATDTALYIKAARAIIDGFSVRMHFNDILYLGYDLILALMLVVLKTEALIVLVQLVINALSVILVYEISEMLFNRRTAVIAGLLYAFTWPLIFWSSFVLSDSFFVSLLLLTVYFLLKAYSTGKRKFKWFFSASCIYMFLFRPTGIISVAFILLYIIINLHRRDVSAFIKRYRLPIIISAAAAAGACVLVIKSGVLLPLYNSTRLFIKWILYNIYANGQIFDVKTAHTHKFTADKTVDCLNSPIISFFVNNWYNILILYAKRAVYFWAFNIRRFNLFKLYLLLTYLSGAAGMYYIIKNRIFRKTSILLLVILSIMVFCVLVFMDSAFRYKMPVYIFLNIIAAYGFDRLVQAAANRRKPAH